MKQHHRNNYITKESPNSSAENTVAVDKREPDMHTAFRVKTTVRSQKLEIEIPELELILGREVEIIILTKGTVEDGSKPSEGRKNSSHTAGSIILDDEALRYILADKRR